MRQFFTFPVGVFPHLDEWKTISYVKWNGVAVLHETLASSLRQGLVMHLCSVALHLNG